MAEFLHVGKRWIRTDLITEVRFDDGKCQLYLANQGPTTLDGEDMKTVADFLQAHRARLTAGPGAGATVGSGGGLKPPEGVDETQPPI